MLVDKKYGKQLKEVDWLQLDSEYSTYSKKILFYLTNKQLEHKKK